MEVERRMTIGELAREAGVTPRTVRYYVSEGLLPPPTYEGRQSYYGPRHLLILRAIRAMQAEDLPLRKIAVAITTSSDEVLEEIARRPPPSERVRGLRSEAAYRLAETPAPYDRSKGEPPQDAREVLASLYQRPGRRLFEEAIRARVVREEIEAEEPAWRRLEVADGVEVHFTAGGNPEREAIIRAMAEAMRARLRRLKPPEETG
jgi:DNA-binding transcriptional MerR regulator